MCDEFLDLEDKINAELKKLTNLLDNLSKNLSKEKTEKAIDDGFECINDLENLIKKLNTIFITDNQQNIKILMIKSDFNKQKEKFDKFHRNYITNKSNELIMSFDSNNNKEIQTNTSSLIVENNNEKERDNKFEQFARNNGINIELEMENFDQEDDENDEYFNVNKDVHELNDGPFHENSFCDKVKRIFKKIIRKIIEISRRKKYNIIIAILIGILLALFIILIVFQF